MEQERRKNEKTRDGTSQAKVQHTYSTIPPGLRSRHFALTRDSAGEAKVLSSGTDTRSGRVLRVSPSDRHKRLGIWKIEGLWNVKISVCLVDKSLAMICIAR